MAKILIVEDYLPLAQSLMSTLNKKHEVFAASSLFEAKHKISLYTFDLVILDRQLPDGDGLELLQILHEDYYFVHVLVLTQFGSAQNKIEGLEIGADDYLAKPFDYQELTLRVEKLLQTHKVRSETILNCGQLSFNPTSRILHIEGEKHDIVLRRREAEILAFFLRRINRLISREDIMQNIWSDQNGLQVDLRTVDVYLRRLRLRLGSAANQLQSIRGVGYRLTL